MKPQYVQQPASRWKTWRESVSPTNLASAAGSERHSHSGTPSSGTATVLSGTPARRKYFWARMSVATWLQPVGTWQSLASKTTLPSGLAIFEVRGSKATPA